MGIWRHYLHFERSGKVLPALDWGLYFPTVFKNPTKYIIPQPEMRDVLAKLRKEGKFIFLATNSHWEYMELIMSTTLGKDWRSFFDMVCANARKSYFWSTETEPKMYVMDRSKDDFKGPVVQSGADLTVDSSVTYLEGSAKILEDLVKKVRPEVSQHRYIYFGDQYLSDVVLCSERPGWDGVAVIEEMSFRGEEYKKIEAACPLPPLDLKMIPYADHWGDFF